VEHATEGRFQLFFDRASRVGSVNLSQAQFNLIV
jgi:hypothetical protein